MKMKKFWSDENAYSPGTSGVHMMALAAGSKINVPLMFITAIIVFIAMMIILVTFGLSTFLGVAFIGYAGITLLLGRGKYIDEVVIALSLIGVGFIALGYFGFNIVTLDFTSFEPVMRLHTLFIGSECTSCL